MIGSTLAATWRVLFLFASAPMVGAALLALIGRVTGAAWPAAERPARWLPFAAGGAALLGLVQLASPAPPHLALWLHPVAVGLRGAAVLLALWWAMGIVARRPSTTPAAVTLAIYAVLVTPIASDWLLGGVPGHSVSAAGMMLVCQQVAATCALPLALGTGDERERQDLARLMVAGALGLGYLFFMDYLIIWFGNLPSRVDFYVARGTGPAPIPLLAALLLGWVVPVALLAQGNDRGRRWAAASVLAALLLVDGWWVGAGALAAVLVILALGAMGAGLWLTDRRTAAHG
jgi:hypothetical protein